MKIGNLFKGMSEDSISQIYHSGHEALDILGNKVNFGYGTPLCAPENLTILGITKEVLTQDNKSVEYGYGVRAKGLETGYEYLYWHCLPYFPVWGGDRVSKGQIIAFMGNAGRVYANGSYVPLELRTTKPYLGTHLHFEIYDGTERIDPLPLIDFDDQPTYSIMDYVRAITVVIQKIAKNIK